MSPRRTASATRGLYLHRRDDGPQTRGGDREPEYDAEDQRAHADGGETLSRERRADEEERDREADPRGPHDEFPWPLDVCADRGGDHEEEDEPRDRDPR